MFKAQVRYVTIFFLVLLPNTLVIICNTKQQQQNNRKTHRTDILREHLCHLLILTSVVATTSETGHQMSPIYIVAF